MSITYRKLGPGDAGKYRNIRLESLRSHPESFGAAYEEEKSKPILKFEEVIEVPREGWFMMGAFDQDELIGISGFVPFTFEEILDVDRAGTLIQMYVRSSYSGKKIGLNLTRSVIQEAFKLSDMDQIILGVREGNIPAIRVYEQAGFKVYPMGHDDVGAGHAGFQVMILQGDPGQPGC